MPHQLANYHIRIPSALLSFWPRLIVYQVFRQSGPYLPNRTNLPNQPSRRNLPSRKGPCSRLSLQQDTRRPQIIYTLSRPPSLKSIVSSVGSHLIPSCPSHPYQDNLQSSCLPKSLLRSRKRKWTSTHQPSYGQKKRSSCSF